MVYVSSGGKQGVKNLDGSPPGDPDRAQSIDERVFDHWNVVSVDCCLESKSDERAVELETAKCLGGGVISELRTGFLDFWGPSAGLNGAAESVIGSTAIVLGFDR